MKLHIILAAAGLAAVALAAPATAANFIKNGSFEAGAVGNGAIPEWTRSNTPDDMPAQDVRASVISYNNTNAYPTGAFGESVTPDNAVSASPDAVGTKAAYFVGDFSVNETWSQMTYLGVGNYKVGFSYYLTQNGLKNVGNASLATTILGVPVANTMITSGSPGKTWLYASGVAQITVAGHYVTSLVFNSNLHPSKDVVVDRVFGVRTTEDATVIIPPGMAAIPEPETWAMMLLGFGMLGVSMRRRQSVVAA
jgi:PEP-CTERM motif